MSASSNYNKGSWRRVQIGESRIRRAYVVVEGNGRPRRGMLVYVTKPKPAGGPFRIKRIKGTPPDTVLELSWPLKRYSRKQSYDKD